MEDEPDLTYSQLWALDGNNSLKRLKLVEHRVAADRRIFEDHDYYLPCEYVDRYANEVRASVQKAPLVGISGMDADGNGDNDDDDDDDAALPNTEGDPTDAPVSGGDEHADTLDQCVRNWKSAAAEEKKKTWAIFDEAGIFASACRHGLILWLADMVRSGEL